ncbi:MULTISPECIES: hypothetical protein [unclassified Cedecea]|uniref:hypothetical protein n=1 Tax=unclassified Cedecea TaxID=2649846 RepID=UPI0030162193
MELKLKVYNRIQHLYKIISRDSLFIPAVETHCRLMIEEFKKDRLYYKYIFSNNRFVISTVTASVFFNKDEAFLSDVVSECLTTGLVSHNTITSLLLLFNVSGRISLGESDNDKRKKNFKITRKGRLDIIKLLNTMVPALSLMFEGPYNPKIISDDQISVFFKSYAKIHRSSLFIINFVNDLDVFISKDSGHMILVYLYMLAIEDNKPKAILSLVSKECGVSRTHLRNILIAAEEINMLSFNKKTGEITIYESFVKMFTSYMAYYFSFVQFGLEGGHLSDNAD